MIHQFALAWSRVSLAEAPMNVVVFWQKKNIHHRVSDFTGKPQD